ncbi:Acetoacetate decarboxylase [Catenulispora acidiphila DSM 44928]|uniref:Acetoacetate decarboxylase n=1 Tax=Catenulispora acidiphila (strain DSM 44928 / JCM 14897 / NBRC 102108 / NRRL B-24433 / ID139908) TaxID=479433 RepID=C7QJI1_CATAD|nr:acetoacetate decarboxylase family protein [Catenulispora acidiphila]ACU71204.1 Acetoacetate decarboxylase [Catenulispora acidiphila DSM 44928]
MPRVRYGPRDLEAVAAARESAAKLPDLWSTGVHAVWETDPDALAQVLPPPLKPTAKPYVRATINQVDMSVFDDHQHSGAPLGAAAISVACAHGGEEGWYSLVMPMTTERSLIGGREVFGEPKKLAEVVVDRDGEQVAGTVTRHGVTFAEIRGRIAGALEPPAPYVKVDWYLKFLPAVDGSGFDADPLLVRCLRTEKTRSLNAVEGEVILRDSDLDPIADLPVLRLVEITYGEKTSDQRGEVVARLDPQEILPYVHQRYDDPAQVHDSVLLKDPAEVSDAD